jgi:four helix bundle protein
VAARDLRERTKDFALRIIRLYAALPQKDEARVIGKQVLRSGTSVGAHYREGSRARSNAEFISKMSVGLQELDETDYWLELLDEANIMPTHLLAEIRQETQELIAIFVTIINKAKTN